MNIGKFQLEIHTTNQNFDPIELAHFLFLFRATYSASVGFIESKDFNADNMYEYKDDFLDQLKKMRFTERNSLFSVDLKEMNLAIEEILKSSPIRIKISGLLRAIIIAVIISGGEVDFKFFRAKINPIGNGIRNLRKAFTVQEGFESGYVIKNKIVTLSEKEYDLLMKEPKETKGKGGFQSFLVGLQYRINHDTRELELTDNDVDKIIKYGTRPKEGGWQQRLRTIFNSHFKFDDQLDIPFEELSSDSL